VSAASSVTDCALAGIGDDDYEFIRHTVYEHSRINLGAEKKALVSARITKRLRALKLGDFTSYCTFLRSPKGKTELPFLVEVISTNHTHFFRENRHFDFLREVAIPKWRANGLGAIRIWSAASSSGEEPFTIAIVLAETLGLQCDWRIVGTDISARMLEVARAGIYSADRLSHVPTETQRRFFQRGVGASEGQFRIKEELRRRIEFSHLNLLQPTYPFMGRFDAIFCRNVMIYFDRETQETLVEKMTPHLAPGGYLMVGHSETLSGIHHNLTPLQPALYQKK
jgi:chemotaxis protein methyltransferase CheR